MEVAQNHAKYIKTNKMEKLIEELKQYKQFSKVIDIDFVIILIKNYLNARSSHTKADH